MGNTPLRASGVSGKITDWRGSLFVSDHGPFKHRKCIASLHPAYVLREFSGYPLLKFDLIRALGEGYDPSLLLPTRALDTNLDADTLCNYLDNWPSGVRCSVDIEGTLKGGWPCVSVARSPTRSVCIVWSRFSDFEYANVLQSFARLMARRDVPKVLQNQLYNNFILSYGYGIPIRNVAEDTLIKGWSVYAELPRALSTQASVWTRQPHWKNSTMYEGGEPLYVGCAMDSAVTLEICNAQDTALTGRRLAHYRKMIELQNPFLYMELRGIRYNSSVIEGELAQVRAEIAGVGATLEREAGQPTTWQAGQSLLSTSH